MRNVVLAVALGMLALWCGPLCLADDKPKKEPTKITVAAEKTPFQQEVKFGEGDCYLVVLPNKREVALWTEKDRFPFGEQKTKSGLQCLWGEKPFKLERLKDSYIKQGAVITTAGETTEHELFVGEWQLSYINDLTSTPELKVRVVVKKREEKKKDK
jgi:hypothetical protein